MLKAVKLGQKVYIEDISGVNPRRIGPLSKSVGIALAQDLWSFFQKPIRGPVKVKEKEPEPLPEAVLEPE